MNFFEERVKNRMSSLPRQPHTHSFSPATLLLFHWQHWERCRRKTALSAGDNPNPLCGKTNNHCLPFVLEDTYGTFFPSTFKNQGPPCLLPALEKGSRKHSSPTPQYSRTMKYRTQFTSKSDGVVEADNICHNFQVCTYLHFIPYLPLSVLPLVM